MAQQAETGLSGATLAAGIQSVPSDILQSGENNPIERYLEIPNLEALAKEANDTWFYYEGLKNFLAGRVADFQIAEMENIFRIGFQRITAEIERSASTTNSVMTTDITEFESSVNFTVAQLSPLYNNVLTTENSLSQTQAVQPQELNLIKTVENPDPDNIFGDINEENFIPVDIGSEEIETTLAISSPAVDICHQVEEWKKEGGNYLYILVENPIDPSSRLIALRVPRLPSQPISQIETAPVETKPEVDFSQANSIEEIFILSEQVTDQGERERIQEELSRLIRGKGYDPIVLQDFKVEKAHQFATEQWVANTDSFFRRNSVDFGGNLNGLVGQVRALYPLFSGNDAEKLIKGILAGNNSLQEVSPRIKEDIERLAVRRSLVKTPNVEPYRKGDLIEHQRVSSPIINIDNESIYIKADQEEKRIPFDILRRDNPYHSLSVVRLRQIIQNTLMTSTQGNSDTRILQNALDGNLTKVLQGDKPLTSLSGKTTALSSMAANEFNSNLVVAVVSLATRAGLEIKKKPMPESQNINAFYFVYPEGFKFKLEDTVRIKDEEGTWQVEGIYKKGEKIYARIDSGDTTRYVDQDLLIPTTSFSTTIFTAAANK